MGVLLLLRKLGLEQGRRRTGWHTSLALVLSIRTSSSTRGKGGVDEGVSLSFCLFSLFGS